MKKYPNAIEKVLNENTHKQFIDYIDAIEAEGLK
jgi:hypothetical protein